MGSPNARCLEWFLYLDRIGHDTRKGVETFINQYQPPLTVDNFFPQGIKFLDESGKKIVVVAGTVDEKYLSFPKANADIFVIAEQEALLGWVEKNCVIDAGQTFLIPRKSLNKMPKALDGFVQECQHLRYFGGFKFGDDEFVTCFGCGKEVVG